MNDMTFLNKLKKKSQAYAYQKYGHFVDVDEAYEYKNNFIVNLKVEYPLYTLDDRSNKIYDNQILDIHNIGSLVYTEKGELIEHPERAECDLAVKERLNYWREQLQKIIISVTSKNLARITRYSNFWNPITFIISAIIYNDEVYIEEFESSKPNNILRYLNFLDHLEIITQEEGYYKFSSPVKLKLNQEDDIDSFREWVLSVVIEKQYETIRDAFSITQLTPLVRTENVYYIPSLNADELLYKTLDSLTRYYAEWYDNQVSKLDVQYWLMDLVKVGVINYEDKYFFGNESMFDKMMSEKETVSNILPAFPF